MAARKAFDLMKDIAKGLYQQDDKESLKKFAKIFVPFSVVGMAISVYYQNKQKKGKEDKDSFITRGEGWRLRNPINLHKILVGPAMWFLMKEFNAFNNRTYLHLGIHSAYGILWVIKDYLYGDKKWQSAENYFMYVLNAFIGLNTYYSFIQ